MSAIKDVYDIIKELRELSKEYNNAEMSELVVEIQGKFFDIREEIETLRQENKDLSEKITELLKSREDEEDLELTARGYYIKKSERANNNEIPYCSACWKNSRKLYPIAPSMGGMRTCTNCKHPYR